MAFFLFGCSNNASNNRESDDKEELEKIYDQYISEVDSNNRESDEKKELEKVYDRYISKIDSFKIIKKHISKVQSLDTLNYYINLVEDQFADLPNINIQNEFKRIYKSGYFSFIAAQGNPDKSREICIYKTETAIEIRSLCLYYLTKNLLRKDSLEEVNEVYNRLDQNLREHLKDYELRGYQEIENYLEAIKKLDEEPIYQDEVEYQKVLLTEPICRLVWLEGEGCYNFDLLTKRLKKFITEFPESEFVDNAEVALIDYSQDCFEGEPTPEWALKKLNRDYNAILNKYPDTDLKEELNIRILENTSNY